ncbi:hypothetical protein HELRODRAFT_160104 [Helobdella robusta]|uniref:Uncharacterized protein n=1 Tax=Helobdella robusta TaxID=6412 RepID=T1EPS8_HELRO|nr:hypothetical protein HELRODRAFT_160104 [Helobdella robusta]ESO05999.1 hypothetical protein HELRODRAFT_160104 [Helobdella robusta]
MTLIKAKDRVKGLIKTKIVLGANKNGDKLVVRSIINDHNHVIVPETFQHTSQQRKLCEEEKQQAELMIGMGANPTKVKEYLSQRSTKRSNTNLFRHAFKTLQIYIFCFEANKRKAKTDVYNGYLVMDKIIILAIFNQYQNGCVEPVAMILGMFEVFPVIPVSSGSTFLVQASKGLQVKKNGFVKHAGNNS